MAIRALNRSGPRDESFRYEVVDAITRTQLPPGDPSWGAFAAAARRLIERGDDDVDRQVGAFALAHWPVDKSPDLLGILLGHLRSGTTHTYRAVTALGRLGAAASDALPDLMAYADRLQTEGWNGTFVQSAQKAACRIDPTLGSRYPEAAEQLRIEEASEAALRDPWARPETSPNLAQWASRLVRSGQTDLLTVTCLHTQGDRESARQDLLRRLEADLATAPESLRADLEKACEIVRTAVIPPEAEPEVSRSLAIVNLTVTARVLCIDRQHPKEIAIHEALQPFETPGTPGPDVTPATFEKVSQALKAVDPEFEASWRKQLRKEYPWLDRTLPAL